MNTNMATIEAHMHYVTTKQLQDALDHEHRRLAMANRPGTMQRIVNKMRLSVGTVLISVGERLQAGHDALEAERLHRARTRAA